MSNKAKILIIDDEEINLDLFDVMFSRLGFSVERAKDGIEGLDKTKKFLPDLILLDNIMPKMSGWELTKTLKADPKHWDIPIVMFSALDDVKDKVAGFELGVDDYITKPFNFSEVLARIKVLLRSRQLYSQLLVRESRLSLAEQLCSDMKASLSGFEKTVDELESAAALFSESVDALNASGAGKTGDEKNTVKHLKTISEKSGVIKKHVTDLKGRIDKTDAEWERLRKSEIDLPQLETKMRGNPVQE